MYTLQIGWCVKDLILIQDEKLSERLSGTVGAFQKTLFKALHGQEANTIDMNFTC